MVPNSEQGEIVFHAERSEKRELTRGRRRRTDRPVTIQKREPSQSEKTWAGETAQVLLVDDDDSILDVNREILETLGYKVLIAQSGEQALGIYESHHEKIDLIILDFVMPGMDGEETFTALKAINPELRVLIISGYSVHERVRDLLAKGCRGFLQKPFRMSDLASKVREIIKARE